MSVENQTRLFFKLIKLKTNPVEKKEIKQAKKINLPQPLLIHIKILLCGCVVLLASALEPRWNGRGEVMERLFNFFLK